MIYQSLPKLEVFAGCTLQTEAEIEVQIENEIYNEIETETKYER